MTKQTFIERKFSKATRAIVDQANVIIKEYTDDGYKLTLRQLYYQFVSRALVSNTNQSYKRLGSILNKGRLAGLIDWEVIEDRTRNMRDLPHWWDPADLVDACSQQFRVSPWTNQPVYVEVWIEKQALTGVIQPICTKLDVPFLACRGYMSQSEQYAAAQRFLKHSKAGRQPFVLHLGDHDPSGIDMTRDNGDRLNLFTGGLMEIRRLALNMDQIEKHKPPPNPAKITDSRSTGYIKKYGKKSWELDALDPRTLTNLIKAAVEDLVDPDVWANVQEENQKGREDLRQVSERWDEIKDFLNK